MLVYNFEDPNIETTFPAKFDLARSKKENYLLTQYFALHLAYKIHPPTNLLRINDRKIASFLGRYFEKEPGALPYLCHVTPSQIDHLSAPQLEEIIRLYPQPDPPTACHSLDILGQNEITPGEMWYPNLDPTDLLTYTPPFDLAPPPSPEPLFAFPPDFELATPLLPKHLSPASNLYNPYKRLVQPRRTESPARNPLYHPVK